MKPQSAKQKGRLLQQLVRDKLLDTFKELTHDDVKSTSMGAGGADIQLSTAAKQVAPIAVECKSITKFVGYTYYDQAVSHCTGPDRSHQKKGPMASAAVRPTVGEPPTNNAGRTPQLQSGVCRLNPVVVVKANHRKPLVMIDLDYFMGLLSK